MLEHYSVLLSLRLLGERNTKRFKNKCDANRERIGCVFEEERWAIALGVSQVVVLCRQHPGGTGHVNLITY